MLTDLPPDWVQARVVANGTEITYARAGRGHTVVVLAGCAASERILMERLPRHFACIAPFPLGGRTGIDLPPHEFAAWMRGFLDALGTRASLVADPCYAPAVLGFLLAEPDRVERAVFLGGQPVVSVPLDPHDSASVDRAMASISGFLGGAPSLP